MIIIFQNGWERNRNSLLSYIKHLVAPRGLYVKVEYHLNWNSHGSGVWLKVPMMRSHINEWDLCCLVTIIVLHPT